MAADPESEWRMVTTTQPDDATLAELRFAWAIVRHVKSNAIVLTKNRMLVGVGAGQMSRVDSTQIAIQKAGDRAKGSVLASDAFFPFGDSVKLAAAAGIRAVIQPGGSKRDDESIAHLQRARHTDDRHRPPAFSALEFCVHVHPRRHCRAQAPRNRGCEIGAAGIASAPCSRSGPAAAEVFRRSGRAGTHQADRGGEKSQPQRRRSFAPISSRSQIARIYEQHGATCLSVLTDEKFFQGSLDYLRRIRAAGRSAGAAKGFHSR